MRILTIADLAKPISDAMHVMSLPGHFETHLRFVVTDTLRHGWSDRIDLTGCITKRDVQIWLRHRSAVELIRRYDGWCRGDDGWTFLIHVVEEHIIRTAHMVFDVALKPYVEDSVGPSTKIYCATFRLLSPCETVYETFERSFAGIRFDSSMYYPYSIGRVALIPEQEIDDTRVSSGWYYILP